MKNLPGKNHRHRRLQRLVACCAARQLSTLPLRERADVLEGIAQLLAGTDRDLACHTAGLLRQADEHQHQMLAQLNAV